MGLTNEDFAPQQKVVFKHAMNFLAGTIQGGAGIANGTPSFLEISTFGIAGMRVHAAGDDLYDYGPIFPELDKRFNIEIAIEFHSTSTDADSITWKFLYDKMAIGVTTLAAPTTEITLTAKATPGSAYVNVLTPWYSIPRGTFGWDLTNNIPHPYVYGVECHALGTASADEIYFWGLWYRGTPNITGEKDAV